MLPLLVARVANSPSVFNRVRSDQVTRVEFVFPVGTVIRLMDNGEIQDYLNYFSFRFASPNFSPIFVGLVLRGHLVRVSWWEIRIAFHGGRVYDGGRGRGCPMPLSRFSSDLFPTSGYGAGGLSSKRVTKRGLLGAWGRSSVV